MAAHMLEASFDDIEVDGANYRVKGSPDRVKTIQEIAFALDLAFDTPEGMEPYLDETAYYDTPNCTWPFGTHIAIVEIDEETGKAELVRYVAVDDVGNKINPMIVDGQLHGGIAQGVGQALWEGAIYDDEGQLLTGSMLDYAMPRASFFPIYRARRDGHAVAGQPDRRQGRRRGRRDRQHGGRRQRRHRRPEPARHPASRHAVHARRRCGARSRARREARRDPGGIRVPAPGLGRRGAAGPVRASGGAKVLAGGQSLLPLLKLRLASADTLIDIGRLAELKAQGPTADGRLRGRCAGDLRRAHRGHLAQLGGRGHGATSATSRSAIAARSAARSPTADPASDLPAMALALDYSVVLRSQRGERTVPLDGFFEGPFQTGIGARRAAHRDPCRGPLPAGAAGGLPEARAARVRLLDRRRRRGRSAMDGGIVSHARVALTGVGSNPYRAKAVEAALLGSDGSAGGGRGGRRARHGRRRP